ncbi:MAG: hypothetical protein AAB692_00490, partial [Patescibacteria group bacterium]
MAKLDVSGKVRIIPNDGSADSYNEGIRINDAANSYAVLQMGGTGTSGTGVGQWTLLKNPSNNFEMRYNGAAVFDILSGGNVGIGTASPGAKLQTGANFTNLGGRLLTSNAAGWVADGVTPSVVFSDTTTNTNKGALIGLDLHNDSPTINTYSPMIAFSRRSNSTSYNSTFAAILGQATGQGVDSNWVSGDLVFATAPAGGYMTESMRITSGGNVGVGTMSPTSKLQVETADAAIRIKNSNDTTGGFIGDTYGAIQIGMYNPSGGAVGAVPASTAKTFFIVNQDGKVGSATNNYGSPAFRNLLDDGSGNVLIEGGSTDKTLSVGVGTTFGRHLTISAGPGASGYGGGTLYLYSGASGATSGGSGAVLLSSKDTSVGSSGFVQISTGYASGASNYIGSITIDTGVSYSSASKGQVFIGNTNAANVEIGNTSGAGVLVKTPAYAYTERVCHGGSTGNGVSFSGYLSDCAAASQADYAEQYPMEHDVEYGDIVVASAASVKTKDGDRVPVLEKSTKSYQNAVYGVASNNYGDPSSIGYNIDEKDNPKPLALNGRVPTKVSAENGAIQVGDPITTSSKPGVGMKATRPGMIIGYALNSWNGAGLGKINVFINTEYYPGGMFDENGDVSVEFKTALSLWGASSGWLDCPVSGDCSCPNGYFVTDIRDPFIVDDTLSVLPGTLEEQRLV